MTATTRGTMRPNGRSPPFLAIGLFIALCVMGFNYWNLSAKNAEQANEISIINAEKLTARSTADKRIDSLSKQVESLQRDVTIARTAKETETSRLVDEKKNIQEKCEEDMRNLGRELEQCRELSNELKRKVESFSCGEEQCQSLIDAAREKALRDVYQAAGVSPLLTMHQKGVDLGRLGDELNDEFNLEIERQRQLAQLQQAGQNLNLVNQQAVQNQQPQQPNQAGEQQPNQGGEQQPNQAGEQQQLQANQQLGDQGNQQVGPPMPQDQIKADDGKNLINDDPHHIQLGPGVKVYPTVDNKQPYFQPRVGMQVGNVNENEAGDGQREAGSLGSLVDRLRDQKGDTGLPGDSIPILPKPGAGSLDNKMTRNVTRQTLRTTASTTSTKHTNLAVIKSSTHHTDNVNAKNEVGQDNDAEDNKLPSGNDNDKKFADDDVDAQDYEYEEDEDEDQYDDEDDDVDKIDVEADDNKIDETRKEMEMGPA